MIGRGLRIGLFLSLMAWAETGAGVPSPSKCGRENAGDFWPQAANTSHVARNRAARCGTLLYCARTTFGWKWKPMTVNVRTLIAKAAGSAEGATDAACAQESAASTSIPTEKPSNPQR